MEFSPKCCENDRDSVLLEILTLVADAEGVDPIELSPPLHDVIDTDALYKLVHDPEEPLHVTFPYRQWTIEVRGGDEIQVVILSDDQ